MIRVRKVPGIKRHIAVDMQGLPHAIADVTGRAGTSVSFSDHQDNSSAVTNVLGATVEVAKRNELHTFSES